MYISRETFWLQKAGCSPEEYEDGYSPKGTADLNTATFRCAVTDGATETSFSALWAQLLADSYVDEVSDLAKPQKQWLQQVSKLELPWYAQEKMQQGAFAALVGLELRSSGGKKGSNRKWEAKAVGDSCLFHIRDGELIKAFPLDHWQQFNKSPILLSSYQQANKGVVDEHISGVWKNDDIFYLMSDAISCWFLRRHVEHGDAIEQVAGVKDQKSLDELVSRERRVIDSEGKQYMPNDDVTLMRVCVG